MESKSEGCDKIDYKIRKPTDEELNELKIWFYENGAFCEFDYQDIDTVNALINDYYYVVIEDYVSDCPDYSGKLMFCVFGIPEFRMCFGWVDNKIKQFKIDRQFI